MQSALKGSQLIQGSVQLSRNSVKAFSSSRKSFSIRAEEDTKTEQVGMTSTKNEPQRFVIREGQAGNIATAALPSLLRAGSGMFCSGYNVSLDKDEPDMYAVFHMNGQMVSEKSKISQFKRPAQPIELYEFEGCPFCRKVREACAILDLNVLFYPCPKDGPNFREAIKIEGGKSMFPYMKDPNTGLAMYESDDIIAYLFQEYGSGEVPLTLRLGMATAITAGLGMIGRMGKGSSYRPAKMPEQPLEYWGYEGSPFCKIVREVLVELELPHIQYGCARGSPQRQILLERTGRFQVPYLKDPNTGVEMFESADIIEYLEKTYAMTI
eukprot:CAMPEP_0196578922 /NCGR_PEP_ID=MMETSP1081-20130531/13259_1 /TAXON_ID=36882 /ORGANISM="Pyramimonas amylifera, Strain CCMP720" /LENGTH=323 /DNA_ID=CAMNT_0041898319 /DNA_START=82 /DNA_END=1053 /DNA_ORIENTATION=+